jgi:hypothetical protein
VPGVATIVVVQSDDLAAWIGVAGVAVGVALGAGIDSLRTRRAERKRMLRDLIRAGSDLAAAAGAFEKAVWLAGDDKGDAAWVEVIDARSDAMRSALVTIRDAGDKALDQAALAIVSRCTSRPPSPEDKAAFARYVNEAAEALSAFTEAARKAKL